MDSHNPRSLHIYVEMPNTLLKDGVLSPMLAPEENLQHYADRAGSTKKEDILAYLESTFKGRSRSISVLTEPIPDNANKKLLEFRNSCQHVVLPPVEKLINAGIVEEIRSGNRPYNVVDKMDYSERIDWNRSLSGLLFKNIPHYMIVLTSGKIPPSFLSNEREIRQNSILRTAIPLYKDDGSNQWPHISRVLTEGYKYCDMLKMEMSDTLYAAILFHDCAKGEGKSKKDHGVESARKAKPLIKQFFDSKDLDIVLTAISEHNIPKPASSKIGELLKAADANILDIPWFLNKLYWKRKEKGMSDEEAFSECLEVIQKGYLTYDRPNMYQPKYWTMRYGKDIPRVRKEIEELTVDKVKRIVKDYIKKYGTRSAFESLINIKDEDMEKGIESLEAEIGMKIEPSTERFYIKDEDIEKEVLALPRISRNNLKNVVKPGDLILVYPRKFSGLMGKLSYKLNTLGQQSVFSSIKMIGLNNKVIGYGVKEIGSRIDEVSVNSLADRFSGIVVLRHKNMTPSIATKIYNWVYDKFLKKIPYGYTDILKAVIHRMFKVVGMVFDVETMEDQIQSLYCSTILHLAYKKFNFDTGLNKLGLGDMDIFPKDFLYSPMFKKVGMYISRGEIDSSKESLELNSDTKFARQQEAVKARVEVKEGCELTKSQVADLVLSNYIKRTIKHKELVEKCGKLLLPYLDKYHLDTEQFLKNLEEHDNDKFDDEIAPIYAVATQYNYNKDIRKMFTPVEGLMDKFEKVSWIKHYVRNEHHVAEHFSKHTPDGNVEYDLSNIDVSEKSPLALVEMMADWMAVGIEVGNTAGEWYKKCINEKKYKFSTKDAEMLKELIESEKEILDSEDVKELKYEIEEWRAKFDKNITMALESSSSLPSTINKDVQKNKNPAYILTTMPKYGITLEPFIMVCKGKNKEFNYFNKKVKAIENLEISTERKYHFLENDTNLIEELLKVESDIVSKITNNSTQLDDKITDVDPMDAIMMKPIESNESLNIRSSIDTFCDSEIKTNIAKVAKKYYQNVESHGWGHVIDVLTRATAMVKLDNTHQDTLTIAEFAAICFHDAGLKKYGRDKHEIYSAKIAAQELKKLKFNTEDINLISCAIKEHRASYKGKFTSSISDLVSSADRNAPNLNEMLFRSYSYHIENGKSHEDAITEAFEHIPDKYGKNGYARFPDYYMLRYKQDLAKLQNKLQTITRAEVASIINNLLSNNTKVSSESLSYYVDVIFNILTSGFKAFSKLQNTYRRYADLNRNDKNFIGENEDTVSKNTKGWLNCKWFENFGYKSKYGNVPDTRLSKSEFDSKFTKFGYDDFSKIDTTTEKPLVALGFSKCTDIRSAIQAWMRLYFYRITMLKEWMSKIKQQSKTWSEEEQINTKRNLQTVIGALVDLKSFMNKVSKEIDRYYKSFRKGKTISNESYITIKEIIEETRKPLSVTPGEVTISMESSSSLPPTINKDVQKILDDLKTFTYGLYVKDKSLITDPKKFHDYDPKDLLVQSPDSFEKNRCGMCHDATVYLNDKLSKLNVKFKCVYVESYKQPYMTTHSFVVAELVKGKWGIIDVFSYKSCLNQKVFSFWKEAVDERIVTWKEEEQADTDGYSAFIINSFPPHESNIDVFMKHMYKTGTEHRITYSTESLTPSMEASNIPAKKKQIIDFICKHCDIMDPSKFNSNRYREMLTNMSDRQFDDFMHKVKDKKYQLHLTAPNMKINLKIKDLLKCADSLKLKMFHRIWVKDKATGRRFLTDNEYLVLQLPVRRQEQIIDKKMSVPDNDKTIDGLTGQVSWESKATALTNPEIQILATRNMDASLYEFIKVRGGDINSYAEFKRSLEENGEARLNDLDPTARTRTSVMGGVLLTAMLLDSNL